MGICPADTDTAWRFLAWYSAGSPEPRPKFEVCQTCGAGWLGREIARIAPVMAVVQQPSLFG
jgi:hypothetical protein